MNLKQFGNAFKQAIAEEMKLEDGKLSRKRAERIAPRYLANDPAAGLEEILKQDYVYAGGTGEINDGGGSKVIDSWWAVFQGPDKVGGIKDEKDRIIAGSGNPFSINLSGAEGNGTIELPNDINVEINHGGTNEIIDLTGGVKEDWRDGNYVRIGYLLGRLFVHGYEAGDIWLDENNNLVAADQDGNTISGGYAGLLEFDKLWGWKFGFSEVDKHTTGKGDADFFVDNLSVVGDDEVIYEWLIRQIELGIIPKWRLTPLQCQELHRLGYQPKDLFNGDDDLIDGGTAGHVNVFDWVNGRWVEDFANIEKVHKLGDWYRSVDPDVSELDHKGNYVRSKLSINPPSSLFGNPLDDKKIMRQWLIHQQGVVIDLEKRLTGAHVQELHKLGWDPKDLSVNEDGDWQAIDPLSGDWIVGIDNILEVGKSKKFSVALREAEPTGGDAPGGRAKLKFFFFIGSSAEKWLNKIYQEGINPHHLTVTHIQRLHQQGWDPEDIVASCEKFGTCKPAVIDPATGLMIDGFTKIDDLGLKKNFIERSWRNGMGGLAAGPRNQELDGAGSNDGDNKIMDGWFELTKIGGGVIANNELTAANARALWNNNWESGDIRWSNDGSKWGVWDPLGGKMAIGFDEIIALGDKKDLENAFIANYQTDFRKAANAAVIKKAHDELDDNNYSNNFIIGQYRKKGIIAAEAVEAYNVGWIYGLEIFWNSHTNQRGVSPDGGKNIYVVDWRTETRDHYMQNCLNNNLDRQKMNAYQVDDTGRRWRKELGGAEKYGIQNAMTEKEVEEVQKEIREISFGWAVRQAATGAAAADLGGKTSPFPTDSDFIIGQYNKDGITPAEVVAAYNKGWIYGSEIRIEGGQKQYRFAGEDWQDLDWTVHDRATYFDNLSGEWQVKTTALQLDNNDERWDPPLVEKEIKEIEEVTNPTELNDLLAKIKKRRLFFNGFWATAGASQNASSEDILTYWDLNVNLTCGQAADLYNGNPQILGSELTKSSENVVVYNGKDFDFSSFGVGNQLRAAKQAKIDADNAANAAAAAAARLASAKTTAETVIKTAQKETGKVEVSDAELNEHLKDTDKVLDDACKSWQEYIQAPTTESEVSSRRAKVEAAITAIRTAKETPPFEPAAARTAAIAAVKSHWKTKSNDQTEDGAVNGKKISEVLGDDWEKEFNDKDKADDIDNKKKELTDKIDAEKAQEELTDEAVEQSLQIVLNDTKPQAEVVKSWQSYNNTDSELKTAEQIKNFLEEEIKGKEEDFMKHLEELLEVDRPTGNSEEEKVANFVANQKAEIVVKAVLSYKLKDASFRNEKETEMEDKTDGEGQPLDEKFYPKENGKYTREAMIKFLFEQKTGQSHQFSEDKNTLVSGKSHWEEWKYWYIGGGILILSVGLVVVFWDKLMGSTNQDE